MDSQVNQETETLKLIYLCRLVSQPHWTFILPTTRPKSWFNC